MSGPEKKSWLITRLIAMLDYALGDKETDELTLEVNIHGMSWQEDERSDLTDDENPGGMFNEKYLSDPGVLMDSEEFTTAEERCPFDKETISREDLKELRRLLAGEEA